MKDGMNVSRRQFLKMTGLVAGAAALPGMPHTASAEAKKGASSVIDYRQFGKSKLKLSSVSVGTGSGQDPKVLKYAIKKGINFFHVSPNYAGGRAIKNVAKAIQGQRDKVIVGLKVTWDPNDDGPLDDALKTLGINYADIAFFNIHNAKDVTDVKYRAAATRWKKAGRIKHIALTSHDDTIQCMKIALRQGFYDGLMPSYNLTMKGFDRIFEQAEKQGVGLVLMKTGKSIDDSAYDKAVAKYLAMPSITTINKTLDSFEAVDKQIARAALTLSASDERELETVARIAAVSSCQMCGSCTAACPNGLAVGDMVRCSDYYLADSAYYGMAKETYDGIAMNMGASGCTSCGTCESACTRKVPIRSHIQRVAELLA